MSAVTGRGVESAWEQLVARGCLCGTEDPACPIHKAGDNRGLRAWFEADLPYGFPMERVNCGVCRLGAQRCREESEQIVVRCETEGRDLTDRERTTIELYVEGARVLSQADALMYPSPEQDEWADEHPGEPTKHIPSTICPRCSTPDQERRLRELVEKQGLHKLKPITVFEIEIGVAA